MARGWESKSVESQQDDASRNREVKSALTDQQRIDLERRRTLELSRARALDDLNRASAPHHRRLLEQTLAALDAELSKLIR
jgi:hypothetical protein